MKNGSLQRRRWVVAPGDGKTTRWDGAFRTAHARYVAELRRRVAWGRGVCRASGGHALQPEVWHDIPSAVRPGSDEIPGRQQFESIW